MVSCAEIPSKMIEDPEDVTLTAIPPEAFSQVICEPLWIADSASKEISEGEVASHVLLSAPILVINLSTWQKIEQDVFQ